MISKKIKSFYLKKTNIPSEIEEYFLHNFEISNKYHYPADVITNLMTIIRMNPEYKIYLTQAPNYSQEFFQDLINSK